MKLFKKIFSKNFFIIQKEFQEKAHPAEAQVRPVKTDPDSMSVRQIMLRTQQI